MTIQVQMVKSTGLDTDAFQEQLNEALLALQANATVVSINLAANDNVFIACISYTPKEQTT